MSTKSTASWVGEIARASSRDERRRILMRVPSHQQDTVRREVEAHFARRKAARHREAAR